MLFPDLENPFRVSIAALAALMLGAATGCSSGSVSSGTAGKGGSGAGGETHGGGDAIGSGGANAAGGGSPPDGTGDAVSSAAGGAASIGSTGVGGTAGNPGGAITDAGRSDVLDGGTDFVHPGILHTQAELDRMQAKVNTGAEPWLSGWKSLTANSFSQSSYTPHPQGDMCAGNCPNGETYMPLARDAAAAYQNALRYRIAGTTANADNAVAILNAWSATLQTLSGDSNAQLRAGLYGYQLAAAAELVRDYSGWKAVDFQRLKNLMVTLFYATCSRFLSQHNGTCFDHYWANWDLASMTTILAVGVLTDDRAKFDEAMTYFKSGSGAGQIDRLVNHLYPGTPTLGQGQESGRDQGHATLDISLVGAFAKIAYDQSENLFGYEDNKILALAEYTAKYNLGQDVPWTNYTNCENQAMVSISSNSRGDQRPSWELLYNQYVKVMGLYAPYTEQFAEQMRPEGGGGDYGADSGGFDQLGFGTLTFTQD